MKTVTARLVGKPTESWSVSTISPTMKGKVKLNVSRHFDNDMPGIKESAYVMRCPNPKVGWIRGDADGREFNTRKEATEFALKRGYLQPWGRNFNRTKR